MKKEQKMGGGKEERKEGSSSRNNSEACKVASATFQPLHSPSTCQWVMSVSPEPPSLPPPGNAIMEDSCPKV